MTPRSPRRRLAGVALLALAAVTACGGGGQQDAKAADQGVTITMWTRAATQAQSERLVAAYNNSHKNQVKLTVIPTDNYQPRIASAAGARQLPDVFAADVIFVPNYTSQGLFLDVTDRVNKLPFKDSLAPSHMKLGTREGRLHTLPHTLDLSVWFWNKDLYAKAGLDPEKGPTTLKEFAEQATAVDEKLGKDGKVHGTFFGGNCGGCYVFTFWPSVWAAGGQVMNAEGTASLNDQAPMTDVFKVYRDLYAKGVTGPTAKEEQGPTWTGFFPKGEIGVMPMPSTTLGTMPADMKIGVAPIAGPDGGESTFVGGDSIGISATSEHADAAWEFLAWTVSDEAQVEVMAKNKDVLARTDLSGNKYSSADPRVVLINSLVAKGQTPYAPRFGETFNDPQGPWLRLAREAVFGDAAKLPQLNADINKSLQQ
ncbi:multiple sugar transport system substrate-binding protein [Streptosporangium becharense]|uniref:Multiple sugar transport system substrate-binding protein n=1 Tax=Streptosporangium becharense TaxID=1816182 RepID=A0A7W9IC18_9ACTN|nr:sugar ABC transporter substrate-binding protein [Streptosporangium becharense]MBB2910796.1 multiple sugar transport system substrate-binding protein [Streptosporangium becharense]MBB5817491.1 multiple sugar transport system substrate-binding protein [Streptosporangium becharense]